MVANNAPPPPLFKKKEANRISGFSAMIATLTASTLYIRFLMYLLNTLL